MNTVARLNTAQIVVKRSRFIGVARPVASLQDAQQFLGAVREMYPQARHYCHAYVLEPGQFHVSDDGEPEGTGGAPLLSCLQKNEMAYSLVAVARYFGGVLLGTGGLAHAYADAACAALQGVTAPAAWCQVAKLRVNYDQYALLKRQIEKQPGIILLEVQYYEMVELLLGVEKEQSESLLASLRNILAGQAEFQFLADKFCLIGSAENQKQL